MSTEERLEGGATIAKSSVEGSRTILDCFKEYSAAVGASDGADETRKNLWNGYIATLKETKRTLSGCLKEYGAAIDALCPAGSESPDTKSLLWKTYMALIKDYPSSPENLRDVEWTAPKRGDRLSLYRSGLIPAGEHSAIFALPSSLRISRPDFVFPALAADEIARFVNDNVGIQLPSLWAETSKDSNVLTVRVNDRFLSDHPLDIAGMDSGEAIAGEVRLAVRRGLAAALDQIETLEKKHESGTAEPGPYRLAFGLADAEREDDFAKYMKDHGNARAGIGKSEELAGFVRAELPLDFYMVIS